MERALIISMEILPDTRSQIRRRKPMNGVHTTRNRKRRTCFDLALPDKAEHQYAHFQCRPVSEAMMYGNASRCKGKYLFEYGLTGRTVITLDTPSQASKY